MRKPCTLLFQLLVTITAYSQGYSCHCYEVIKTTWYTEAACFYFWYWLDVVGKALSFPKWSQAPTETTLLSWIRPLRAASPQWPLVEALKVHFLFFVRACLGKTGLCS